MLFTFIKAKKLKKQARRHIVRKKSTLYLNFELHLYADLVTEVVYSGYDRGFDSLPINFIRNIVNARSSTL